MFEIMGEQLLDAVCDRLKPVLYTDKSYTVVHLKASVSVGDHHLTWALDPQSWSHFPISTRTVQALTEVEAFSLAAEDLKSAASQFRRLHSKQLQHTFQEIGKIITGRKRPSTRRARTGKRDTAAAGSSSSLSLEAASRFASNVLRKVRHNLADPPPRHTIASLPQKPMEPLLHRRSYKPGLLREQGNRSDKNIHLQISAGVKESDGGDVENGVRSDGGDQFDENEGDDDDFWNSYTSEM
ncbi:hypothetical protein IGI04_032832 [Brassica rapa subsp. trilocularis]|uniref:Uncharacterized protein n=1 Tax=Brassica rapa subsp. trilocularis TaxID=1813537 RepID=A0ABQ7LXK8_BRACM|nr:hypothetical protein IGI04_032832 [Brassica rapa subsp. trilocularis]